MCENCTRNREDLLVKIRELANFEGELYEEISKVISLDDFENDDEREQKIQSEIMQALAVRCALYVGNCPTADEHGAPPSLILGIWAGSCMQMEAQIHMAERASEAFRSLFGMGRN